MVWTVSLTLRHFGANTPEGRMACSCAVNLCEINFLHLPLLIHFPSTFHFSFSPSLFFSSCSIINIVLSALLPPRPNFPCFIPYPQLALYNPKIAVGLNPLCKPDKLLLPFLILNIISKLLWSDNIKIKWSGGKNEWHSVNGIIIEIAFLSIQSARASSSVWWPSGRT